MQDTSLQKHVQPNQTTTFRRSLSIIFFCSFQTPSVVDMFAELDLLTPIHFRQSRSNSLGVHTKIRLGLQPIVDSLGTSPVSCVFGHTCVRARAVPSFFFLQSLGHSLLHDTLLYQVISRLFFKGFAILLGDINPFSLVESPLFLLK